MHLRYLKLLAWRNYHAATVELCPGVQLLTGANGQGKTNLLEAIHYLATGRSHRVADQRSLIHTDFSDALIEAELAEGRQRHRIEMRLSRERRNQTRIDGTEQERLHDALGYVRAVLFAPEDVVLVRGDPSDRRRFLDDLLAQRRPAYRAVRQDYERALRQRNALLRDARRHGRHDRETLTAWSEELIRLGARLVAARLKACAALRPPVTTYYKELTLQASPSSRLDISLERSTGHSDSVDADCEPDIPLLERQLRTAVSSRIHEECERGISLIGPHRDDLRIDLDGLPAKTHASQGEAWSIALAMRLASRQLLATHGGEPITLLDDVFAQLDEDRRQRLASWCEHSEQLLVSAAVVQDVPLETRRLHVVGGSVTPTAPAGGPP